MFISISGYSQIYNTQVEAKIELKPNNNLIEITVFAFNKTEIDQSLRYVLSVIKNNPQNSNKSKNDQSGRLVLEPIEKKELSKTVISTDETSRIIILLLIYNVDDELLGKDRIVINENEADRNQPIIINKNKETTNKKSTDGVVIRGIVLDETKTKSGRDFYKLFYSLYSGSNINGRKIVTIKEILVMANTTGIEIKVGDEIVYSFIAKPGSEYLKDQSNAAIKKVYLHFQKLRQNNNNKIKLY